MSRLNNTRPNLANGHKIQQPVSEPARYGVVAGFTGPGTQGHEFGGHTQQNLNHPVAGPSGYTGGPHLPPPAPVYQVPNHSGMPPPPNRHYYPNHPPSHFPNVHYNGAVRASVPGPSQAMQAPASPAAWRPNQFNAPNYN